ncbi:hypothetical protein [Micrococcus terreus]|uniref:Uncharacterized protein n=1 Tax=Micrococcus terreus TaxID=574650 RepID=A0A1I7MS94_9MICC|nr:hypothetical protein [Micrococcus terreus]MCT2089855.1 hypothetical protein [Micrococcus terreus]SFV24807.1 hypothetical protein SAMN04487966_11412 [Micrococcus terreus]
MTRIQENTMETAQTDPAVRTEEAQEALERLGRGDRARLRLAQWRQGWVLAKIDAPLPGRVQRLVPEWASTQMGRVGIGLCALAVLMLWLVPFWILAGL